ncbi:microtubule-associated protein futsch-like isoform X2 [Cydia strobilella]|uniref:microtubule-associated protein futsch-like isoform X2 n=1 Tax=Cydia strobilella TaxID=1100964 RepID=UPI0030075463
MDEDVGVKVTRLRRRLSVEQSEDGGSPAPSTPTKKRGGRLAAKPQLELIEENAQVSSPRKTRRKSLATEAEEKPITPSRRSARIKSNSSIVSETLSVTATDSPRAKRAARRNSQAGSDNDGPATPVRQTKRIRKDSASSVEALGTISVPSPRCWPDIIGVAGPDQVILPLAAETSSHEETSTLIKPLPVSEMVIEEEPENEVQKIDKSPPSAADTEELSPNSARKSQRLLEKRNRRSGSYKTDQDSSTVENKSLNISTGNKEAELESQDSPSNKSVKSKESNDDLSESNMSLLKKIETESKINKSNHNKSTSALDTAANDKSKRIRTESWPVVTISEKDISFSDNELSKKRKGKSSSNTSGFNVTDSPKINKSNTSITDKNTSHSFLDTSSKRKKKNSDNNIEDTSKPSEDSNMLQVLAPKEDIHSTKDIASEKSDNIDDMAKLFESKPGNVQATVYFEDSDSNSAGAPTNKIEHIDSEDQCVPEVKHDFQEKTTANEINGNDNIILSNQVGIENVSSAEISIPKIICDDVNDSCEPMDIDETIHEEILQKSSNKSFNLSKHSILEETNSSKRKPSISNSATNTPDLSKNDKRKSSISNSGVNTPEVPKDNKRKTSISSSGGNTPDLSKNDRRKSSVTESIADTSSHPVKTDKRKSSISSSETDTPDKTKIDKRTSSISNSTADTPDLSKSNTNNKSTLILSQLKDVSSTSDNVKSPKLSTNELLSKSDINENSNKNKKISKGNLSLNDVKGTPKQNAIPKLTMQTSTPITTHQLGIKTKTEEQKQEGTKKIKTNFSKSINETDSSEEDSENDESYELSVERNKHIDDEAEEACDDYESGDSQDEEDRRYEEENEIVQRGETLTSDDDMSNDTNYEKDSFVVSSDEDDNELLSGSGDDLSMSDKELTMSKKSKKKFNERKLKEQKNASREMFESRHKLNSSDRKSPTPKTKKNRMRIDSSLLTSDEEVVVNPKKSNRMRLDSTLNESAKLEDTNVSLTKSNKNKSKQDSALNSNESKVATNISLKKNQSMHDSATDEREITVCNDSTIDNADPLQALVKQEPKTPQKDMNISVVQFTDREEIENVQITEGNSIMNQTGTDPLQATMASEDTSDSSENEEILQNYDSVLNELNKDNKTKFNKNNVSLNSGNTTKRNQVEPIIDQLNLTHTKKSIKDKGTKGDVSDSKIVKVSKEKQESDNEDSSDSIDLQLLFSEDNCGSDEDQKSQQNKADDDSMFVSLKKSPGKTNIRESIEMNASQQVTTLNESSENNKNRKCSVGLAEAVEEQDIFNVSKNVNISMNESGKKKKKKHSISEPKDTLNISKDVNVSMNEIGIKKKKKHSISEPAEEEPKDTLNISKNVTISINESGKKKKKKHSVSEPAEEETHDTLNISKNVNISLNESGIKKKKKHSVSEPAEEETQDTLNISKTVNNSMNESGKKKKKKHSVSEPDEEDTRGNTFNISKNKSGKKKKKHYISEPAVEENEEVPDAVDTEPNEKTKKKKKRKCFLAAEPESDLFFIDTTGTLLDNKENTIAESSLPPKSEKKKKKQKLEALVRDDDSDGAPDEAPYRSEKASEMDLQNIESVCESAEGSKKKHKKKKKKSSAASNYSGENIDAENIIASNSKKRKRKSSNTENSQESGDVQESVESGKHNELVGSNKKRKISHREDNNTSGFSESKNAKKKKKKNRDVDFIDTASTSETTETQVKKNKKRKHRDDDGDNKQTKVKKDSSFQEVHVPRLPDNILQQLDDKPRKIEPPKVIATSNFIVENARQRRVKPSNYLEESIYLDEKSPVTKKQKQRINKPKVLPFIPTASISDSGYTTNFKINKLSQTTRFEAEPLVFSKETYLQKNNIKRLGTYDRYKKQMHHKMSKF